TTPGAVGIPQRVCAVGLLDQNTELAQWRRKGAVGIPGPSVEVGAAVVADDVAVGLEVEPLVVIEIPPVAERSVVIEPAAIPTVDLKIHVAAAGDQEVGPVEALLTALQHHCATLFTSATGVLVVLFALLRPRRGHRRAAWHGPAVAVPAPTALGPITRAVPA